MRTLEAGFRAHLDTGATTLCHCWRLETGGGEVFGFTDHDLDLTIDGVTYEAQAGLTASEIESSLGLAVDNLEASGALSSASLSEVRLRAGDFDNAAVEIWRVNWQDVSQRILLRSGNLGEVTHGSLGFAAEVRGLAHVLNQPKGRIFQFGCDAVLGDARCGVNLATAAYTATGSVIAAEDNRRLAVAGLDGFDDGWFARGSLTWASGANTGRTAEVKTQRRDGTLMRIDLWQEVASPVASADAFTIRAGCDKQFSTCRGKFGNGVNFRGFPQIPGEDFVLSYATRDDPHNDGKSRN
ncbi:MAG: DUF2163 domain-containing protein [Rhizobiales bacterium]|nr:DUF2163 domain-containing protein [Hyphomicrobiales bacterium]MBI3672358.1 DUF2163 domain-containing protein [Hyphomicrobiales bacterium]